MKEQNNTVIQSFLLFLALSVTPLTALARDSLEAIRTDLNTETTERKNVDNTLSSRISQEGDARSTSDSVIHNRINGILQQLPSDHYIGEYYAGGKVFYVDDSGQHGLIAALADQTTGVTWYNLSYKITGTVGDGLNAGSMNTAIIVSSQVIDNQTRSFAAKVAANYSVQADGFFPCTGAIAETCYGDWYLPSKYELNLLFHQKVVVGGFGTDNVSYWSSSEYDSHNAWSQNFFFGNQNPNPKHNDARVRAIRAF